MAKRVLSILTIVTILLSSGVALAQNPVTSTEVLLLLPVPQPDQLPAGITAEGYTYEVARPLLQQLAQLRAAGRIADFKLRPELHAISVRLSGDSAALDGLPGPARILPADGATLACAGQGAHAVREVVDAAAFPRTPHVTTSPQATNPSITVSLSRYTHGYSNIYGGTNPSIAVYLVLKNVRGQVKFTATTTSNSGGSYSFAPTYMGCGYDFEIVPGDTVEVTAAGNTVRLLIVPITAFPDPTTDTVTGSTAASRRVDVELYDSSTPCSSTWQTITTASDGAGNFAATFSPGFNRSASAYVHVYDANENSVYTDFSAPSLLVTSNSSNFSGYLKPEVPYTAILRRGGSPISTINDTTDETGWYYDWFSQDMQGGDVVEVGGGGITMSLELLAVSNLVLNPDSDHVSGNIGSAGAGRVISIEPCHSSEFGCASGGCKCLAATADAGGNFDLNYAAAGYDLQRRDYDYDPSIHDAEGNVQLLRGRLVVPITTAQVRGLEVHGYWDSPNVTLTIVLRAGGGAVRDTQHDTSGSYDAEFQARFSVPTMAGDHVEVGAGAATTTLVLPDLTARLDVTANSVSGRAPAGSVLDVKLSGGEPSYNYYCGHATAAGDNTYTSDLGGIDVEAGDGATVFLPDSHGHRAWAASHALAINAHKEGNDVDGYAPGNDFSVTVVLQRGASDLATFLASTEYEPDSGYGPYAGAFSGQTIQEGDVIRATLPAGSPANLTIPPLSATRDVAGNRIYGHTAPNAPVAVRMTAGYNTIEVWSTSDAGGDYSASFAGLIDWSCRPVAVNECYPVEVTYFDPEGHTVWQDFPPPGISADTYEPDDDYTSATSYSGPQEHNFHAYTDTDWISFTVGADDISRTIFIQTMLGVSGGTYFTLYDTDGISYIESGGASSYYVDPIVWQPEMTGTYYIKVDPLGSEYAGVCGATYILVITDFQTYLPLVSNGYSP